MEPPVRFDLDVLEFGVVREMLVERLVTPLGRTKVLTLQPIGAANARAALQEASELAARMARGDVAPITGLADVLPRLTAFIAGERVLDARDIADIKRALRAASRSREWLRKCPSDTELARFADVFPDVSDLVAELELIVDDRGDVLTTASASLAELRKEIDVADSILRGAVARFVADERNRRYLQSTDPSWRHDRPVFQVRQEHRQHVPGVLHDRSQSGSTVFIEPSQIVESANRLSDAKAAEHREIQVVLAHVSRGLRGCENEIADSLDSLAALDLAQARAHLIANDHYFPAQVVDEGPLRLREAIHPILLRRNGSRDSLVPLDLGLHDPFSLLVITGPNTGGKTVVLKTVGLLALMSLSGVPIPALEGSQVPSFDGIFADIGDDQGISQNLSTFSSHVTRITRCLKAATSRSLVLLDELGTGTDPEEGAALGYAVLEELVDRGAAAIATTHLGQLKEFAYTHPRVENGCMSFDGNSLRPLYRLEVGIPGASHALDIAARVGMPDQVVARARIKLQKRDQDRALETVVARVQAARREAESERKRVLARSEEMRLTEQSIQERSKELEVRNAWLGEEAGFYVEEELRKLRDQIEGPLKQLQNAPRPHGDLARQVLEQVSKLVRGSSLHRRRMQFLGGLARGSTVYVPRFGKRCEVRKLDRVREMLTILVGKLQIEIPFEDVSWLQPVESTGGR